jgi:hypothetical protein
MPKTVMPKLTRRHMAGVTAATVLATPQLARSENAPAQKEDSDMMNMNDMTEAFESLLSDYVAHWNDYDADGMVPFWDTEDPGLIYVAEEIDALKGWPAIEGYFRGADPETTAHLITYRDVTAREIAPGVLQAFWTMNWNVYFATEKLYQKPIGGEVRVTALMRQKEDAWKFFHWIEAPLASLIQLKRAHEANVDPRLIEQLKAKGIEF